VRRISLPRMLPAASIRAMEIALQLMRQSVETGVPVDRPDLLASIEDIMQLMGYEECASSKRSSSRRRSTTDDAATTPSRGARHRRGRRPRARHRTAFRAGGREALLLDRADASAVRSDVEAQGAPAIALTADVADSKAIDAAFAAALAHFGRIDVLVNVAGISSHGGLRRRERGALEPRALVQPHECLPLLQAVLRRCARSSTAGS
jgi:hypothetical protein